MLPLCGLLAVYREALHLAARTARRRARATGGRSSERSRFPITTLRKGGEGGEHSLGAVMAARAGHLSVGLALRAKRLKLQAALRAAILIYGHSIPFLSQKPSGMRPVPEEAVYPPTI